MTLPLYHKHFCNIFVDNSALIHWTNEWSTDENFVELTRVPFQLISHQLYMFNYYLETLGSYPNHKKGLTCVFNRMSFNQKSPIRIVI